MYKFYTACDTIENNIIFWKHGSDVMIMMSSTQNQFF